MDLFSHFKVIQIGVVIHGDVSASVSEYVPTAILTESTDSDIVSSSIDTTTVASDAVQAPTAF